MIKNNLIKQNKLAAMFGLDARIALAIFGALSVITGAALYSAISNAKATAMLTEMQELSKAWESYYLDTGSTLAMRSTDKADYNYYIYNSLGLKEKPTGVSNWNGPYISYPISGSDYLSNNAGSIHLHISNTDETWGKGSENDWTNNGLCISKKKCFVTVEFTKIKEESTAITIDKIVDNGDGANKGHFRWYYHGDVQLWLYLLQTIPIKNPND